MNKNKTKSILIDVNFILDLVIVICVTFTISKAIKKTWFKKDPGYVNIKSSNSDGWIHLKKMVNCTNYIQIGESHIKIKGNNLIVDGQDYGKIPDNAGLVIKDGKIFILGKEVTPLE